MSVATKSLRCPTCGAKSPADATRCRVCTRSFGDGKGLPSDEVYREELYGESVATPKGATATRISRVFVVAVLALAAANYFFLGFGPSWAHRAETADPGANWTTYRGFDDVTAALPGHPIVDATDSTIGEIQRARVGVDGHWDPVLDASTTSAAARQSGAAALYATIAVGRATAPGDVGSVAASVVGATIPGLDVSNTRVTAVPTTGGPVHDAFDVVGRFTGSDGASGTLRGRVFVDGSRLYVFATASADPGATALQRFLVSGFSDAPGARAVAH